VLVLKLASHNEDFAVGCCGRDGLAEEQKVSLWMFLRPRVLVGEELLAIKLERFPKSV
jgi:hypothetical protein